MADLRVPWSWSRPPWFVQCSFRTRRNGGSTGHPQRGRFVVGDGAAAEYLRRGELVPVHPCHVPSTRRVIQGPSALVGLVAAEASLFGQFLPEPSRAVGAYRHCPAI